MKSNWASACDEKNLLKRWNNGLIKTFRRLLALVKFLKLDRNRKTLRKSLDKTKDDTKL